MIRYQLPILELLVDFGDELLDVVHATKAVEIEDVRTKMLDPLRAHIRNATPPADLSSIDPPGDLATDLSGDPATDLSGDPATDLPGDPAAAEDDFDQMMASLILPKTTMLIPATTCAP